MKHQICEICGASLDFGERCDCERNIHSAPPAATSDKPCTSLDMPKEVSGNVEIEKYSNQLAKFTAPMPRYIKDMINHYRIERR